MWTAKELREALSDLDDDTLIALNDSPIYDEARVSAKEMGSIVNGREVISKHAPAGTKKRKVAILVGSGFYLGCGVQIKGTYA